MCFNTNSDAAGEVCSRLGVQMLRGGKGDRVWGMLHGGPQFSGLSLTKIFFFLRCLRQAAGISSEAISEGGAPLSAGLEAGQSG